MLVMLVFELMRFLVEQTAITVEMGWSNWQILEMKSDAES